MIGYTIIASAPTRLDFGGGWTDVPPYPEERGGFVCNLAIERRATVTLTIPPTAASAGSSCLGSDPGPCPEPLPAAALRRAGITHAHVAIHSDFPIGAGLGGSSSVGVALAAAIARLQGTSADPAELAEQSRRVEAEDLGVAGGFQDHYAAAFGGALALTFAAENHAEPLPLTDRCVDDLERCLTVVYTGESRISGETITAVLDAYRDRVPRVVAALDRMAVLARGMRDALVGSDLATLAALVDEHWHHQRSLHPRITTDRIDALEARVREAGATGFKALGASGGGSVLVCSPVDHAPRIQAAAATLGAVLSWRVARDGVRVGAPSPRL
ncbi:hypothetical protein [Gemmatimonas aurantiaca]|uniref:GHMP family kinase ATP-binding protein n=1 Tax=Gemmatimonas aurantiaca TaxID=173480 RepID=UPI00301E2E4B